MDIGICGTWSLAIRLVSVEEIHMLLSGLDTGEPAFMLDDFASISAISWDVLFFNRSTWMGSLLRLDECLSLQSQSDG